MSIKGQKVNPIGWRVGIHRKWKDNDWFQNYKNQFVYTNNNILLNKILEGFLNYNHKKSILIKTGFLNQGNNFILIYVFYYNLKTNNNPLILKNSLSLNKFKIKTNLKNQNNAKRFFRHNLIFNHNSKKNYLYKSNLKYFINNYFNFYKNFHKFNNKLSLQWIDLFDKNFLIIWKKLLIMRYLYKQIASDTVIYLMLNFNKTNVWFQYLWKIQQMKFESYYLINFMFKNIWMFKINNTINSVKKININWNTYRFFFINFLKHNFMNYKNNVNWYALLLKYNFISNKLHIFNKNFDNYKSVYKILPNFIKQFINIYSNKLRFTTDKPLYFNTNTKNINKSLSFLFNSDTKMLFINAKSMSNFAFQVWNWNEAPLLELNKHKRFILKQTKKLKNFYKNIEKKDRWYSKRFGKNIMNLLEICWISLFLKQPKILAKFIAYMLKQSNKTKNKKQVALIRFILKLIFNISGSLNDILGVKIQIKGRFDKWRRTKSIIGTAGTIPIQQFDSKIEYGSTKGVLKKGTFGVRIWVRYDKEFLPFLKQIILQYLIYSIMFKK